MATLNIGMKVNRAITGATTVNANAYAMVTYLPAPLSISGGSSSGTVGVAPSPMTRYFGPGQSIPSTFDMTCIIGWATTTTITGTAIMRYSLQSGVELINTI